MGVRREDFWQFTPRELGSMQEAFEMTEKEQWLRTLWVINANPWGNPGLTLDDVYGRKQTMTYEEYEAFKARARKAGLVGEA